MAEKYICVSKTRMDDTLYDIWHHLAVKHGMEKADRILYPLKWYVTTGRINTDDLHTLCFASKRQIAAVANRLAKGGSADEAVDRVLDYLHQIQEGQNE